MIVKDEESINKALQMLETSGAVRYSDQFSYIIITDPTTLEHQCVRAIERNDVAIVAPRGQEHEMEDHAIMLPKIRKERAKEEREKVKEWVEEHPRVVEKFEKKLRSFSDL